MTQAAAHRKLNLFLAEAQNRGNRVILVITGKGRTGSDGDERGILRRRVPEWLSAAENRALVVGFDEAAPNHGGGGALYVRIRRMRD